MFTAFLVRENITNLRFDSFDHFAALWPVSILLPNLAGLGLRTTQLLRFVRFPTRLLRFIVKPLQRKQIALNKWLKLLIVYDIFSGIYWYIPTGIDRTVV